MKYANLILKGKNMNNLGDQIQILAVDYLYGKMGISKDEIVYINKECLSIYDGEPVYLPVSMPLVDYKEAGLAGTFSDRITPIFLGLILAKEFLNDEEADYLRKYEPIGCRDERTYNTLCRYNIKAYLGGCLSVLLPRRNVDLDSAKKRFFIDINKNFQKYIPDKMLKDAVFDTHLFYGNIGEPRIKAIERYQQYYNEASLVVTSLLHAAVPCMAMGIPVILVRDHVSYRFAWLEALLDIYTPETYTHINWSPSPVECEMHKKRLTKMLANRLRGNNNLDEIDSIHRFYMNRAKNSYVDDTFLPIKRYLEQFWKDKNAEYRYSIWGLTQTAEMTVHYINENYSNAKLCHVYDSAHKYRLGGIVAQTPDNIKEYPEEIVLVTAISANDSAKKFFQSIGRPEESYALSYPVV